MKKLLATLLSVALIASLSPTSLSVSATEVTEEASAADVITGEFIECVSVSPEAAKTTINNSGMSGLYSYIHLHNSEEKNAYLSNSKTPIVFAFENICQLGNMYIWNYNVDGKLDSGMKDVKLEYSADGNTWTALGNVTLARALESENKEHGGNAPNNIADSERTPVDFGGISAKYVRVTPISNYGGNGYGLSEVRFFRYKTRPVTGSAIYGTARAPYSDADAANISNGYGLSDKESLNATHDNAPETMWYSTSSAADSMIIIDLDGNYPISKIAFWNYNDPDNLDSGIQKLKVEVTSSDPYSISNGQINYNSGSWKNIGSITLNKGDGSDTLAASKIQSLFNIRAQYIRLTPISNYGGEGFGLSEVKVFTTSGWATEPARDWTGLFSSEGSFDYQLSGTAGYDGSGWLSADGIYTLNLTGADAVGSADYTSKTLFMFSDTAIGNFNNYEGESGKYGLTMDWQKMMNHSYAILEGNTPDPRNMQFYYNTEADYGNILQVVDWQQELVRIGTNVYCWGIRFNSNWSANWYDLFRFDLANSGVISLANSPQMTENTPIKHTEQINGTTYNYEFGQAVLDNTVAGGATPNPDGYIYIYGLKSWDDGFLGKKCPIVARVTPIEYEDVSKWRYWNGSAWVSDPKDSAPLDENDGGVSSEYSVTYIESGMFAGKYMLNFTNLTMSTDIRFMLSDSLTGPFTESTRIYTCDEIYDYLEECGDSYIYTYNAKAHPHLSNDGELLISYNINSTNYNARLSQEYLYPHFITLFEIGDDDEDDKLTYTDGENIAVNATAVSASDDMEYLLYAQYVNDGDDTTRWACGEKVNEETFLLEDTWIYLDFGKIQTFDKVVIDWEEGRARQSSAGYKLQYSDDGVNWKDVNAYYSYGTYQLDASGMKHYTDVATFAEIDARYLRVSVMISAMKYAPSIWEIEVYDRTALSGGEVAQTDNLAYGKEVTVKNTKDGAASYLTDANYASYWSADGFNRTSDWVYVDFGSPTYFDRVELYWLSGQTVSAKLKLEISDDALTWTEIANITDYTSADYTGTQIKLDTALGRYLRLSSSRSTGSYFALTEIKVFCDNSVSSSDIIFEGEYAFGFEAGETAQDYPMYTLNAVATGETVVYGGKEYTIVVKGDVTGDGLINSTDFMHIRRYYLGTFKITGAKLLAADVDDNGVVNSTDFMRIRRHFLETYNLYA